MPKYRQKQAMDNLQTNYRQTIDRGRQTMSAWLDSLVNNKQTPAERQAKYRLAREFGANQSWASAMRDWRWAKIFRFYGKEVMTRREMWSD